MYCYSHNKHPSYETITQCGIEDTQYPLVTVSRTLPAGQEVHLLETESKLKQ